MGSSETWQVPDGRGGWQAAPRLTCRAPARCDTWSRFNEYGMPSTVKEWIEHQELFFQYHPPLPTGWIRVWSKSKNAPYFVRPIDGQARFDWPPSDLAVTAACPAQS